MKLDVIIFIDENHSFSIYLHFSPILPFPDPSGDFDKLKSILLNWILP